MKAERENFNPPVVKGSKKSKALGLDAQGIQKTMRPYHYLGDGAAQVALNSISGLIGMLTYDHCIIFKSQGHGKLQYIEFLL